MTNQTLAEFAASFDRSSIQDSLLESERQRQLVLESFPRQSLGTVPMERYADGVDMPKDTLGKLLTLGTPDLGIIKAGAFSVVRIQQLKAGGFKSHLKNAGDAAADWIRLREALVRCCELAGQAQWAAIDEVLWANEVKALRTKLLYVYFPDEILPMYRPEHLDYYLHKLNVGVSRKTNNEAATLNRSLLEHLRAVPEVAGWSTRELVLLLEKWSPAPKKKTEKMSQPEAVLPNMNEASDIRRPSPQSFPDMSTALNQILYGPPGTGKTYSVIREAARIISGEGLSDDEVKAKYDELALQGKVRLATFHQSFSYEDFMEGIRPVMDENGAARFEVRDGVFKEIAIKALFACLERPDSTSGPDFETLWQTFEGSFERAPRLQIPSLGAGTWTVEFSVHGNLNATFEGSSTVNWTSPAMIQKLFVVYPDKATITSTEVKKVTPGTNSNFSAAVFNYLRTLAPENHEAVVASTQSRVDRKRIVESYLQLGTASGWQLRTDGVFPPYVLIIDEINRGNISRIFGELITLIEDDKRHGQENALTVTLPSSREQFTVPPNLFLLGTMNTADKSLALLDVALRRRFDFKELSPDFNVCKDMSREMKETMQFLNERLEVRKDRDHRIGHAFFISVSDAASFNRVFRRKVVPLLQEYFFNDVDGARYVLGEVERQDGEGFLRPLNGHSKWQRNCWRWFTDEEPEMDCWARLQQTLGTLES